jgi:WD40 repeat protein
MAVNWDHNLMVVREPEGNTVSVKSMATGERLKVFTTEDVPNFWHALLAPDGKTVAFISQPDRTIRVFSLSAQTNTPTMVLNGRPDPAQPNAVIVWMSYQPKGNLLATVTMDHTVRFTEVNQQPPAAGAPPAPIKERMLYKPAGGNLSWQSYGVFSPDGQYFGLCSQDRFVRVFDIERQTEKWAVQFQPTPGVPGGFQPWYLAFSPKPGGSVAVLCGDRSGRFLDLENGKQLSTFSASPVDNTAGNFVFMQVGIPMHQFMGVIPVQYTPDGNSLVILGWEFGMGNRGKILLWNTEENKEARQISAPAATNQGTQFIGAFAKDGTTFQSMCPDLSQRLWDAKAGKELCLLKSSHDAVAVAAISPTGRSISTGSQDGRIVVWEQDKTGMKAQRTLRGHTLAVSGLAYAPDGQSLATASYDRTIRFWDLSKRDGERLKVSTKSMVTALAYAPDGKSVAASGADGSVAVWDAAGGAVRFNLEGMSGWVHALAFSPDGQTLAAAGDDGNIRLWNVVNLRDRGQCVVNNPVEALAFAPDGKSLVAGLGAAPFLRTAAGSDTNFRPTNATLPPVHSRGVRGLAFSMDGKLLASVGDDSQLILWKVATWDAKKYLLANPIRGVSFAPDGRHLLTTNSNGTCYIFRIPVADR